jgi:exodeoxyribonuclease V alpha subunit
MSDIHVHPPLEQLHGVVERITFHADVTGYTIARLKTSTHRELVTIVGSFPDIQPGQTLHLYGTWREHPKYGQQFQIVRYVEMKPATLTGIEKYLGSGLIKGIGPVTAKKIVAHFGLETLEVIEQDTARLIEVPGMGPKRVVMIQAAWEAQKAIKEVMVFLQGHGVSTTYAVKIFKQYGNDAVAVVTENPYQLAADIYGIGFVTADTIARNVGFAPNSDFRYRAGIIYILNLAAEDGHCFLPQPELVERVTKQLALPEYPVEPQRILSLIQQMAETDELILQPGYDEHTGDPICYTPAFYRTETALAARLTEFISRPMETDRPRVQRWIDGYTEKMGITLSAQQRQAVELAAAERVLILTGGPGCGKTFTTRTIVALWKAMGKRLVLAAPTGRAAQRLAELTGREAKTVHRLLAFDPGTMKFRYDIEHPLEVDAVVIDESSMLDLFLAHSLIKAIPLTAQLLLVGDVDQLPSVGPGKILQDIITSARVPVVRLTEVFRQAAKSHIVMNAHRINQGQFPKLAPVTSQPTSDCLWVNAADPEEGVTAIRDLVTRVIPKFGFSAQRDIQLLCPGTRSEIGSRQLNTILQQELNPPSPNKSEVRHGGRIFRFGDRVIQLVNDYSREVFNGDMGTIAAIDHEEQEIAIEYNDRQVIYDFADLNEIALAWAVTVHKSQGSEYPVVVFPLFLQHYTLLSRNLLYTGLTRAKQLAVLVGPAKALRMAISRATDRQRYTALAERL